MKSMLLFFILFSLRQLPVNSQRSGKRQPAIEPYTSARPDEPGRYFSVTLSNTDSAVVLVKLGPIPKIKNNDTLTLSKNGNCNSPGKNFYYDLHDPKEWASSCVSWYTLQPINPGEILRFVVKLTDFDSSATNRLLCCYTQKILPVDQHCNMYRSQNDIILQKNDGREFQTMYLELKKNELTENLFLNLK